MPQGGGVLRRQLHRGLEQAIALPGEAVYFPLQRLLHRLFRRQLTDRPWTPGDNINLAVGQGDLQARARLSRHSSIGNLGDTFNQMSERIGALNEGTEIPFSYTLELNGTRDLRFVPAAEETMVHLTAPWLHPSFTGGPLPEWRYLEGRGFTASWRVPDFGRPYPARWKSGEINADQLSAHAETSAFGVSLIQPVDIYQQAERAVKYAVLFLVLTFVVFFMWEIFHTALLHPMQYALVGFALFVFYLLLVSISEHAGFDTAYAISATVTTVLIAGYARAVLKGRTQGVSVFGALTTLYGFLYLLLRLEDYALLAGAIGLFVVLTRVMFLTRRMDWYSLRLGARPDQPAA